MARAPQDVTEAELAVLQVLWEQGPSTRRQLTDRLYPADGAASYTTVQKLLERLETKGFVAGERQAGGLVFAASVQREELISRRLRAMADKLCEGSLTPLLTNLIRAQDLTPREVQELRALLDELARQPRQKGRRR